MAQVLSPSERLNAAILMLQAETFENFLQRKFPSFKVRGTSGDLRIVSSMVVDSFYIHEFSLRGVKASSLTGCSCALS